ncbi:BsuPI-related putative proteinase inhibitor [Metabacillus herbersteinensis]|uniref:Intracellular proteinase inhibitor BsuPI domain-containing protein n=1 Tax=Metabacillus herbersteinensis TaxID=283816 RepID=A0ABV6GEA5_9BACI
MKKLVILFSFLLLCGCGQSSEKDQAEEVSGNLDKKEVHLTVDARENSENVEFVISLLNNTEEEKDFEFRSGQKYEIIVRDTTGKEVYRYSKDRMFTQALQYVKLAPGESREWKEIWNYQLDGKRVDAGEYNVTVTLKGQAEGVKTLFAKETFQVPQENQTFRGVKSTTINGFIDVSGEVLTKEDSFYYSVDDGHQLLVDKEEVGVDVKNKWTPFTFSIQNETLKSSDGIKTLQLFKKKEAEESYEMKI